MSKDNLVYINHMLDAIDRIQQFTANHTLMSFVDDDKTISACAYQIQILGEAATKVDSKLRDERAEIPWQIIADTRHKIVHDYMDIDPERLWEIIAKDLPHLKVQLQGMLH